MKKASGLTLIELLVAVAVFAILVTLGVPNLKAFTRSNRLTSQTNDLAASLNLARSEATRRGTTIAVCGSSDQSNCNTSNWESGWIVFVDGGTAGTRDATDIVLRRHEAVGGNDTIRAVDFPSTAYLQYLGTGRLAGSADPDGTFVVCDPEGTAAERAKRARGINISNTGHISSATDTDGTADGIVNAVTGSNVSCP